MAVVENELTSLCDTDSDDEFFDALVNEDSTDDRLGNKTSSIDGRGDTDNIESTQKCASNSEETAKKLSGDGQPEPEGISDMRTLSKTEPNFQEIAQNKPMRLPDHVQVSNPQGNDTVSVECASDNHNDSDNHNHNDSDNDNHNDNDNDSELDNRPIEIDQGMFHDASSHQPLPPDSNKLIDGDALEGLEAEENEDDKLHKEGENKEDEVVVDEEQMRREREDAMSQEDREQLKEAAQEHKARGNDLFKQNEFLDAISAYTQALEVCPLCYLKERSIMFANRAACRVRREQNEKAIEDCNKALELHPHYLKVWLRRANTYELMEKLDEALADFKQVLELDPSCFEARAACMRLPNQIKERNEKLKEEMFGKLKDLGNLVLRPFGLSTDNFQMQQDPNTGSYSMNFRQNPTAGNGKP